MLKTGVLVYFLTLINIIGVRNVKKPLVALLKDSFRNPKNSQKPWKIRLSWILLKSVVLGHFLTPINNIGVKNLKKPLVALLKDSFRNPKNSQKPWKIRLSWILLKSVVLGYFLTLINNIGVRNLKKKVVLHKDSCKLLEIRKIAKKPWIWKIRLS